MHNVSFQQFREAIGDCSKLICNLKGSINVSIVISVVWWGKVYLHEAFFPILEKKNTITSLMHTDSTFSPL